MDMPSYSEQDMNGGNLLLSQLGSFWQSSFFADADKVSSLINADSWVQAQVYLNYLETLACVSRLTVPVFHTRYWYTLTLRESDMAQIPSIYQPDDLVFGPQLGTAETRPAGSIQTFGGPDFPYVSQVAMPDALAKADWTIQTSPVNPTRVWVYGADYTLDLSRKLIRFRDNPFADSRVPVADVLDASGNPEDRTIALWIYHGEFDLEYVYTQFGYALKLKLASSEHYKDIINALWDMHVLGPSMSSFRTFLAAISGAPSVINPTETVEVIRSESDAKLIITDKEVYRVPLSATPVVAVGDQVEVGDFLTDAIEVSELSTADPDYTTLPSLALSKSMLSGNYLAELLFSNESVSLDYAGLDTDGKAVLRFEISGFPGDVELFWTTVQENGKTAGATLAELLDQRTIKVGEPGPGAWPLTINPARFVLENLMRNNLFTIRLRTGSFETGAPGVSMLRFLRRVMPPHVAYLAFVEISNPLETLDLSKAGSASEAGASESVDLCDTPDILSETVDTSFYREKYFSIRVVAPFCQTE
jgi:hypothetical protein